MIKHIRRLLRENALMLGILLVLGIAYVFLRYQPSELDSPAELEATIGSQPTSIIYFYSNA